jgi:hypothetical protein
MTTRLAKLSSKISLAVLFVFLMTPLSGLAQKSPDPNYQLVGIWAGVAYLDEDKLEEKLKALPSEESRQELLNKARNFLNIIGAFEFKANGEYESDFEIVVPNGDGPREMIQGKYRIVESEGLKRVIELIKNERAADEPAEKRLIQFYEDGQHIAMAIPAPGDLVEFNPLVIFERVPEEQLVDPATIAREQGAGTIK